MTVISSINKDQQQILKDIMGLNNIESIHLDPTYSKGNFYKGWKEPIYKCDINPIDEFISKYDVRNLPFDNNYIKSIVFDPPFLVGQRKHGKNGLIGGRFGRIGKNQIDLLIFYKECLDELYRVLVKDGFLIFKCQDQISGGKQYLNHVDIIDYARKIGFYCKDIFILIADNRINQKGRRQFHARKYHSYFLVLQKVKLRENSEVE